MAGIGDIISPVSEGLGLVEGAAEFFSSAKKEKQDDAELAALKRPFYKIQDEYVKNQQIAGQLATQGLPSSTKQYLTKQSQEGLGSSLSAIIEGGGSPNDIARLFDAYGNSIDKTGAEDAQAKIDNIKYFMGANKDIAGQKNIQFGVNELQPYEEQLKQITERRAADEQNKFGGANTAIGSLSAAGTSFSNQDLYGKLFGDSNPSSTSLTSPALLGNYDKVARNPNATASDPNLQSRLTGLPT